MRNRITFLGLLVSAGAGFAQRPDISGPIQKLYQKPSVAVTDFRGAGDAQRFMGVFNRALWGDLDDAGVFNLVDKTLYPRVVPQVPQDFHQPSPWLTDWSNPPANATHLVFGYAAVQDGRLALFGWLFNLAQPDPATAKVLGRIYFGSLDADGAKAVARQFADDILQQFGVKTLTGTKIYFVSDRTGHKEIWSMDYDGSNQRQLTRNGTITQMPAVSRDGKWLAYTALVGKPPAHRIFLQSLETGLKSPFANPAAPTNSTPEFTPDGQHVLFSSSLSGYTQIYIANLDGSGRRRLTDSRSIDTSPKVNPKTGLDVLFISGRSGKQQLWRMNIDGGDLDMLSNGEGEVANPSWSPEGSMIAFAWTRGYEIGGFNIFIMDIARREPVQLTRDTGVNENPWWAPDGLHLVFTSKRGGSTQVYTMLADGTHVVQLTREGNNVQPVWSNPLQ